jgi:hypothetical protein
MTFYSNLYNANIPKVSTTAPEIRFTQIKLLFVNFDRARPIAKLSESHQQADPKNTPATIVKAEATSNADLLMPTPENTPIKNKIVIGFVTVKKRTDV